MSAIYESIGRLIFRLLWWRFGRQVQLAGGLIVIAAAALGYLAAKRTPPEG
jgi:hypothetical protein